MSICMGQLINDAKDLVSRLKDRENNLDQVVVQSNALAKRVDAIQQVTFQTKTKSFQFKKFLFIF